jgi:hypothetical protein
VDCTTFPSKEADTFFVLLCLLRRFLKCNGEKPDFTEAQCASFRQEIMQYNAQVLPEVAAVVAKEGEVLEHKMAITNNCTTAEEKETVACKDLARIITDLEAALVQAIQKEKVAIASASALLETGTEAPDTPNASTSGASSGRSWVGILVGVVGCVIGVLLAAVFYIKGKNSNSNIIVHPPINHPPIDTSNSFDNPHSPYAPAQNNISAGYMDVAPHGLDDSSA